MCHKIKHLIIKDVYANIYFTLLFDVQLTTTVVQYRTAFLIGVCLQSNELMKLKKMNTTNSPL